MSAEIVTLLITSFFGFLLAGIKLQKYIVSKFAENKNDFNKTETRPVCNEKFTRLFYVYDKQDAQIDKLNSDIKSQLTTIAVNSKEMLMEIEFIKADNNKIHAKFDSFCEKIDKRFDDNSQKMATLKSKLETMK